MNIDNGFHNFQNDKGRMSGRQDTLPSADHRDKKIEVIRPKAALYKNTAWQEGGSL